MAVAVCGGDVDSRPDRSARPPPWGRVCGPRSQSRVIKQAAVQRVSFLTQKGPRSFRTGGAEIAGRQLDRSPRLSTKFQHNAVAVLGVDGSRSRTSAQGAWGGGCGLSQWEERETAFFFKVHVKSWVN